MLARQDQIVATPPRSDEAEQTPAVSIRGISKSFGQTSVLKSVSLDIRRNEFFSLLGPSGCGKTTLLRIIGGFEFPTSGALQIDGRDVLADPPYRRRTNMVFQHGALFPHLTVAGNVAFGLEMSGIASGEIRRRTEEALEMVRLGGYSARQVEQLSGGQRQRVALARALVNRPQVLLLDEPLSALDLQLRLQMQEELRRLQRETKSTFVFVTHDQGEAIVMSDRIAVMSEGYILQVGTPREVYERPARRFVANFMGRSNVLYGKIVDVQPDGTGTLTTDGLGIRCKLGPGTAVGGDVMFAVRYEKVEVRRPGSGFLQGTLEDEVYLGSSIRRYVRISNDVVFVSDTAGEGEQFPVGSQVSVRWSLDAATVLRD